MLRHALVYTVGLTLAFGSWAHAQVKLEYKFKEGTTATYKDGLKAKQVLTLGDANIETSSERTSIATMAIGKREADGTLRITTKVDVIRGQFEIMGMVFAFDSSDPNVKIDNPDLSFVGDLVKAVAGKDITIVLDGKNKVTAVEGADKIKDAAKDLSPKAREALADTNLDERFQRDFEQEHASLPDILVRPGDTWEKTEEDDLGDGQIFTFRRRYEYLGTTEKDGRTLDKIGIKSLEVTYKMDPNSKSPLKAQKSDLKVESSDGHMLFDREAGMLVERTETARIKGAIDFKVNEQDLPSKLDLTYEPSLVREPSK